MIKHLLITSCYECPHRKLYVKVGQHIATPHCAIGKDQFEIGHIKPGRWFPELCPLEDYSRPNTKLSGGD